MYEWLMFSTVFRVTPSYLPLGDKNKPTPQTGERGGSASQSEPGAEQWTFQVARIPLRKYRLSLIRCTRYPYLEVWDWQRAAVLLGRSSGWMNIGQPSHGGARWWSTVGHPAREFRDIRLLAVTTATGWTRPRAGFAPMVS